LQDTLPLVSVLAQQSLDLIKDLVQVLGIVGVNAEYNLTPVEASGLHRQSNRLSTLLTSESSQQKNRGILNTTRGIICEDTDFSHWKNQVCQSENDDTANNDNNNSLETFLCLIPLFIDKSASRKCGRLCRIINTCQWGI
jgi:hypothetical protein